MSSIVSAITGGGGAGWKAQSANLQTPTTAQQAPDQYGNVQQGLQQQQDFLKAVQAQNGLGNQSSVFNQLQGVASGQGPNPAQAMLANATGQNVANQAAMMAGQRGAGANAGMIARQAGQQGAGIQQNAAGQGAALQAPQSLGALGQMGGLANQQAQQQANATGAYNQYAQGAQQNILNAINAQNQAQIGNVSQQNQANAAMQGQIAGMQGNVLGNVMGGLGTAFTNAGGFGGIAKGVGGLFGGPSSTLPGGNPTSADALSGMQQATGGADRTMMAAEGGMIGPKSRVGQHFHGIKMAEGGKVPALVSPGEVYLAPEKVEAVKQGADPIKSGEKIPGKAKVKGNSYANDTVPKTLEEGGIVLPKSVMEAKHPHWAAHQFISAIMKEKALKGKK